MRGITAEIIDEAAAVTEGFSGRELAKMVASMQVGLCFMCTTCQHACRCPEFLFALDIHSSCRLRSAVQAAVYGSREAALTPEIFRGVLRMKVHEHEQRRQFETAHQNE